MEIRFDEEYASKSNVELARLWFDRESLLPEARDALQSEIKNRSLDVEAACRRLANFDRADQRRERRKAFEGIPVGYQDFGRARLENANRAIRHEAGLEEFDQTVFFFVLFFPLVPLAAYRVQYSDRRNHTRVLKQLPIQWKNVFQIWLKTALCGTVIVFALVVLWKVWLAKRLLGDR